MADTLLLRAWLRDWTRHPLQRLLTILGVMIAVAVVLAVDLANQSAQRAFDRSLLEVAGAATHQILGPAEGFPEEYYRDLRLRGWRNLAPIVEGALRLPDGATIYLLGVDPIAEATFRDGVATPGAANFLRLLAEPGTVLVPAPWLRQSGFSADDARITLITPGGTHDVTLLANSAAGADAQIWLADIATAQVLLSRIGRLDRIDARFDLVAVRDRVDTRSANVPDTHPAALLADLPVGLDLVPIAARDAAARELAQAFRINLTAMSLLALLIAAFLIYNTQTFSVLRRLPVLGDLRLVGVSRSQVLRIVLFEALLVGALGTMLGLFAGIALAQGLLKHVALTLSDHFFAVAVTTVDPQPLTVGVVIVLALGLSLLSALAPAWEALRAHGVGGTGRSAQEQRGNRLSNRLLGIGLVALLLGATLAALGVGALVGGFMALFLMITGFLLLVPWALARSLRLSGRLITLRAATALPRLALRSLERGLARSGPAVVALTLALAAAISVSVLVGSFRVSVSEWLGQTLTSDVYVITASPGAARGGSQLPGEWRQLLATWPEVASVSTGSILDVASDRGMIQAFLLQPHTDWLEHLPLVHGSRAGLDQRLLNADAMLITEGFAAHQRLGIGDRLLLGTPSGRRDFVVAGIYRDYSNPGGTVLIRAERFYLGEPPGFRSLGLRAAADFTLDALEGRLTHWLATQPQPTLISSPAAIEAESLAIFDRTFAITHLLRVITLMVAFVAILSALVALQMERAREYAVLRSVGLLPRDVMGMVLVQAAVLGLFAAIAAIPLGLGMGWVLIEVINREAFGWRMDILLPGIPLLENLALGLGAALLASIYPAWRLAKMPLVPALRVDV